MFELATGKFPYKTWGTPFDQLKQVVKDDPPRLPSDGNFSPQFCDFVAKWFVIFDFLHRGLTHRLLM
jgi:hypothetical protein